jgi:hypothetical protein
MAELTEVIGTILKDLAHSRVISDAFTRDVSREYEKDPILVDFPVPRVEIREAKVDFKFAVNHVGSRAIDRDTVLQAQVREMTAAIGKGLFETLVLRSPARKKLVQVLAEKEIQLDRFLAAVSAEVVGANRSALDSALAGKPATLVRRIQVAEEKALRSQAAIWEILKSVNQVAAIQELLTSIVSAEVENLASQFQNASAAAGREALSVDVAVTKKELLDVSEIVMSQISLVTEIRNYEWHEVGDENGKPIRRLRPE